MAATSSRRRWAARATRRSKPRHPDLDIDIKIGVVAGHYGETVRGLDWRMSRRNGRVRTFSLNAKIGRDTTLMGEMRTRINNGKPVLYFETSDAGALFRFTDIYQRMVGGKMWIGMDPPSQDGSAQDGIINVSAFSIRGEGTLDKVVSNSPNGAQNTNIEFSQARADFTRAPGRMIGQGWRAARSDDRRHCRRQHRLHPRSGRDARHAGAALWPQQHVRPNSDRRPVPRRQQRGHVRHHLRGERSHQQSAHRWSIRSRRSRPACCASSSSSARRRITIAPSPSRRFARSRSASAGRAASCRATA